jgi:nucleoid-associated protein YgaU
MGVVWKGHDKAMRGFATDGQLLKLKSIDLKQPVLWPTAPPIATPFQIGPEGRTDMVPFMEPPCAPFQCYRGRDGAA